MLCLSPVNVRKTLTRINPRKAAGPDNIPGRILKDCAEQLTDVLTQWFSTGGARTLSRGGASRLQDKKINKKNTCKFFLSLNYCHKKL